MNFDRVAPHYRWIETIAFGTALQRARVHWLDQIPAPTRALIVGEGNGRFLCELLEAYPEIQVDCLDASARMLNLAGRRAFRKSPESLTRVHFMQRDILEWEPANSYDLIVTHFFLDCFEQEELELVIGKLASAAGPEATWLLADFTIPAGVLAGTHTKLWLRAMYAFFRVTADLETRRLVDPTSTLRARGFVCSGPILSHAGMLKSEMWRRPNLATLL